MTKSRSDYLLFFLRKVMTDKKCQSQKIMSGRELFTGDYQHFELFMVMSGPGGEED